MRTVTVNGVTRSYWLYVPDKVSASAPLVLSLHGTGGHATDKSPFRTSVADQVGCIVAYPQGENIFFPVFGSTLPGWHATGEDSKDIDFFKAVINDELYTRSMASSMEQPVSSMTYFTNSLNT